MRKDIHSSLHHSVQRFNTSLHHLAQRFNTSLPLVLVALMLMVSCHNEDVSEKTFLITPKMIHAHSATFEVAPITNEFYYEADALTLEQYNRLGEQGVADLTIRFFDSLKNALDEQQISYNNDYLYYKGLYDCTTTEYLPAATPCVFYVIRLNSRTLKPIFPFITYPFTTKEEVTRDMTFDFQFGGNTLYVTPSDTFPYLWDYISQEELKKEYNNDIEYYVHTAISLYEEYGFIDEVVVRGPDQENVLDWYPNLKPGDFLYGVAVGYEQNEITTKIFSKSFVIE